MLLLNYTRFWSITLLRLFSAELFSCHHGVAVLHRRQQPPGPAGSHEPGVGSEVVVAFGEEGHRLAGMIRRHFSELDDFRESMSGRPVGVRMGAAASELDWMVLPRMAGCREALGGVVLELEQSRSGEVARGVADGRLDFGIVRDDAAPAGMKRWKLGRIGYSLFAPKAAWKGGGGIEGVFARHPFGELLPGGQFHDRYRGLLAARKWSPRVIARVGSFIRLARLVRADGVAAVLPRTATGEFDPAKVQAMPLPWSHERPMVLLANPRSLDRAGLRPGIAVAPSKVLAWSGASD